MEQSGGSRLLPTTDGLGVCSTEIPLEGKDFPECKKVSGSRLRLSRAIVFLHLLSLSCVYSMSLCETLLPPQLIALIASFLSAPLIKCKVEPPPWLTSTFMRLLSGCAGLAVGLGLGAIAEVAKKTLRPSKESEKSSQIIRDWAVLI